MKHILFLLLLIVSLSSSTFAQDDLDPKTKKLLEQAAKNAKPVNSEITVNGSVHVQAVLIPQVDAKRIFGKEISDNYAVIQLIVGNKSKSAAFIVHGVFIDYSNWPLSGVPPGISVVEGSTDPYQAASITSQVASEEYRVVRGQLLDAQTNTLRNTFLRWLTLAGNLAGAFTFSLNEQGIVKGIAAATGVGIPGLATAWPDRTVEQLNRVSDLGFRTNKLVPKESSEIIVCFFPIDRFLTPGFRRLFLKSPALFFAPLQMFVDRSIRSDAKRLVGDVAADFGLDFDKLRAGLPCYMTVRHPEPYGDRIGYDVCLASMGLEIVRDPSTNRYKMQAKPLRDAKGNELKNEQGNTRYEPGFYKFMALEFIARASLNRVTVTVDGAMAVDITTVAAAIDEVAIDKVAACGDVGNECLWTNTVAAAGVRTGVIRGAYLTGAEPKLAEADGGVITDFKKIDDGSTDNELRFSFKLNAPVPNQTKLHFTAVKPAPNAGGRPLESNTFEYMVAYSLTAPAISSVSVDEVPAPKKLTVKGRGFKTPLTVSLLLQAGDSVEVKPTSVTAESFEVVLPTDAKKLHPGCWQVQVKSGELSTNQSEFFAIPPDPALDSAERTDKFIFVKGKDLIDFSACGGQQFKFILVKKDDTDATELKVKDWNNGAPVLELPEKAKQGEWKVQVVKGQKKSEKPLTVRP